jgi:hypothetical protein
MKPLTVFVIAIVIMVGGLIGAITPYYIPITNPWCWVVMIMAPFLWTVIAMLAMIKLRML